MENKICLNQDIKASGTYNDMTFEGYLAVFGNIDSYGDVIEKGAFKRSINELKENNKTIFILENHGGWGTSSTDYTPLGFFEKLEEDDYGLKVKGKLFSNDKGKNIYTMLKEAPRGSMGMSIGYCVRGERMPSPRDEKGISRFLTDVDLREGSIVTFPANDKARILDVKSEALKKRELEKVLKDNGYSVKESVAISSILSKHIFKSEEQQVNDTQIKSAYEILQKACADLANVLGVKSEQTETPVQTNIVQTNPVQSVQTETAQTKSVEDDEASESILKAVEEAKSALQASTLLDAIERAKKSLK